MDNSEKYLKDIAKNTADIVKELKRINRDKPTINIKMNDEDALTDTPITLYGKTKITKPSDMSEGFYADPR